MSENRVVIVTMALFWSFPCYSHHNAASHYVLDQTITITGTVTQFRLINPHARIYLDVAHESGVIENWMAEGNAAGILKRRGWTSDSLKPGDLIEITGRPARDGGNKIDWELIRLEDGTVLRGGNTVGGERERQLDELEERRSQRQESRETDNPH